MLIMLLNMIPFSIVYAESANVSSLLTNMEVKITQNGVPISEGGAISITNPISIEISFGLPVSGDDPEEEGVPFDHVHLNDIATIPLGVKFKTIPSGAIQLKTNDGTIVGYAYFSTDPAGNAVANVTFGGEGVTDVFDDDTFSNVKVKFSGNFELDDGGLGGEGGTYTITLIGITYTVHVPKTELKYTVTKSGTANLSDQSITWTAKLKATQDGAPFDLAGYNFYDDLSAVGDYIDSPSSFKVNGVSQNPEYDIINKKLSYVFPAGSTGEQTITFKTKIPEENYYSASKQTINNKADLQKDGITVKSGNGRVEFTPQWIKKTGEPVGEGSGGIYNPANRTITWKITANEYGASLNNVVITDALTGGLELLSATLQTWNGAGWSAPSPVSNSGNDFLIGYINSRILLTIVTKVPDSDYTPGVTQFTNSASIRWDGSGTGIGTGNINVGIGYNSITKEGVLFTQSGKPTINWTVSADTRGQSSFPQIAIYDLLVYGTSINLATATGFPDGLNKSVLTPQYNQRYVADSGSGEYTAFSFAITPVVYTIYDQYGNAVADLLEVKPDVNIKTVTFSFNSEIVNPGIYAENSSHYIYNTATMFSGSELLNSATARVSYSSNILQKQMLKRGSNSDPVLNKNNYTNGASEGFDYHDKSVIFRLNVNADGIDLPGSVNAFLQPLGTFTLTDTLPDGWEFVSFSDGSDHMLFSGTKLSGSTVSAGERLGFVAGFSSQVSGQTAVFTFEELNQPYVILVKARPTDLTLAGYFDSNESNIVTNNLNLKSVNWTPGITSTQAVTIDSKILDKSFVKPESGTLKWTVVYNPYELDQPAIRIEDDLPLGLDLRTDSFGNLIFAGNITANELILTIDGHYITGNPVASLESYVSYDNATRKLTFTFPEPEKAYSFSYITDITGEPGTITNNASLIGSDVKLEEESMQYIVTSTDGEASLERNGYVSITKIGINGSPLAGAEFTLYASNGITIIKKGFTASNGILRLKVIPEGTYILKETSTPHGYKPNSRSYSVVVTISGITVTTSIDGKTGADSNAITVQNYVEGTIGNLNISKTVTGNAGDTSKHFNFTLKLSGNGASDTYYYTGHGPGMADGTIKSGDTISLTHGQSITVLNLPKDIAYTVTEADYRSDGYVTTSTGDSGTIVADETQFASFYNERSVSNLIINKLVTGNGGDSTKTFEFTFTLSGFCENDTYYAAKIVHTETSGELIEIRNGDTFYLAHNQSIKIYGLPIGINYSIVEKDYSSDGYVTTKTGDTGTINKDDLQKASFINTRNVPVVPDNKTGYLTIIKTVAGSAGETLKKFGFVVTFSGDGADGTYPYTGFGVPSGTIKSGDSIFLAHGENIMISDLPMNINYTVKEADYSANGYIMTSSGTSGVILANRVKTASFTNTKDLPPTPEIKTGSLTISKTVAGNAGDTAKLFGFTLYITGGNTANSYSYLGGGVSNGIIQSGAMIFLAHGQSITVMGIPEGAAYSVIEADYSADGYVTVSTGGTGQIEAYSTKTAAFTNIKNVTDENKHTGSLTISKTVAGIGADTAKQFKFTVTFNGASGSYSYTRNNGSNGTIKSGDTVYLAHGQSITVTGLPEGVSYSVVEEDAFSQGYNSSSTGSSGIITAGKSTAALFTNVYTPFSTGSLSISKTVTGKNADLSKKFRFTVTLIGAPDAYPYSGSYTGTISSGDSIMLADGESIVITELPEGAQYKITEDNYSSEDYTVVSKGADGTILANALQQAAFTNYYTKDTPVDPDPETPETTPGTPETTPGTTPETTPGTTPETAPGTTPETTPGTSEKTPGEVETSESTEDIDGKTPHGSMDRAEDKTPQTGDNKVRTYAIIGLSAFTVVLISLIITMVVIHNKHSGHKNRK